MPYQVERSGACPASRPWAVVKEGTGEVMGCHEAQEAAEAQMAAILANEPAGRSAMMDVQYRSFTPDLEVRDKGDGRTIVGIAVPYGRPQYISSQLTEQFRRSAFNEQLGPVLAGNVLRSANKVKFSRDHMMLGGELIGRATLLRDDTAGLYGEWRVSRTEKGDETLELVKDGALSELSIAFREGTNSQLPNGVTERVTAELREVAVVLAGAYGEQALVQAVRAAGVGYAGARRPSDRMEQARRVLTELPDVAPHIADRILADLRSEMAEIESGEAMVRRALEEPAGVAERARLEEARRVLSGLPDAPGTEPRAAIPSHSTATTEDNPGGNTVMTNATDAADYRAICAWRDPDGDPDLRESYKFPHHTRPGGPASLPLVRNGLGRLPQSDIPDADRGGVERHLRRHLEDAQD